jgi:hypothetical protein
MKSTLFGTQLLCAAMVWALNVSAAWAQTAPTGEVKGSAVSHTAASRAGVMTGAQVALPASLTQSTVFVGKWRDMPSGLNGKVPVVIFLHGSSGLSLKAIEEWQRWLAEMGVASVAPDSFALPDRLTYKSPVSKSVYEQIHTLRTSEIALAIAALQSAAWADTSRLALAGTSEGAASVARYTGNEFVARMVYAWSCEDNYFVESHRTAIPADQPFLNVISVVDPFFSSTNAWLDNSKPRGHCGDPARGYKKATVVLLGDAPHTLLNLPAARGATADFVRQTLKP